MAGVNISIPKIEEALMVLARHGRSRFNAHQVAYLSDQRDVNAVYDYLLSRQPYVLQQSFEVMCPNFHSTISYASQEEIQEKWIECRICPEEFIPDPERVHIVFDFNPRYLESISDMFSEEKKTKHLTVST
jgi:hypothetical protein